jgi:hypothetical protein
MQDVNSDITEFNLTVQGHVDTLLSMDETCEDLLTNLFEAYQKASDKEFVAYIKQKESLWEENALDIEPSNLMKLAEDQFKTRKSKHIWNKASQEETDLLALQAATAKGVAELVALQSAMITNGGGGKTPGKSVPGASKGRSNDGKWAWKGVAPTGGQPKSKKFEGKDYIYCPFHGDTKWVLKSGHVEGCRNDPNKSKSADSDATKLTPNDSKSRLKYVQALMNAMDAADGAGDEEENI